MTSHVFWPFLSYFITSHFGGYLGPPYLPTLISDVIYGRSLTLILCTTMLAILMQFLGPPHSGSFICNLNLWLPSFLQKLQYETYFSLQRKIAILIAILLQRKSHLDSRHFGAVTFSIGKCTIKAQSVQRRIHCTKKPGGKRYNRYYILT